MKKSSLDIGTVVLVALIGIILGALGGSLLEGTPVVFCEHEAAPKFGSCPIIVWKGEVGKPCDLEIAVATFSKNEKQQVIFYAICPQHHGSIWPVKVEPGPPVIAPKR